MATRSSGKRRKKKKGKECQAEVKDPRSISDVLEDKGSSIPNGASDPKKLPASVRSQKSTNASESSSDQTNSVAYGFSKLRLSDPTALAIPTCSGNPESSLEEEIEWCVIQLKLDLLRKVETKHKEQNQKNIKTLQSDKMPLAKKRQLMRSLFGNYRLKMKRQTTSTLLESSKVVAKDTKVEAVKPEVIETRGTFFGKKSEHKKSENSLCNSVGKDSSEGFKFNFSIV